MTLTELAASLDITKELPESLHKSYEKIKDVTTLYERDYLIKIQKEYSLFDEDKFEALLCSFDDFSQNENLIKWAILAREKLIDSDDHDSLYGMPLPTRDGSAGRDMFPLFPLLSLFEDAVKKYESHGFSREEYEKEKFGVAAEDIRGDFVKAERIVAWNRPIMQICLYFNMIFVLLVGSRMAIEGISGVDVGQLSAMLTYGMQVLMSLMMLSMIYVILTMSAESMKRIYEVLSEEPTLTNPENAVMTVKDGSIDFKDVSFKYSAKAKRYALSDIDLSVRSGMTVGVIGGTGSGKTTFVQLIPRLYDTTEGSVLVGGVDVRQYDIKTLRDAVAMVLQKNLLFSGTIKENLRWGNPNATDEELIEACRLAQAHDFVSSFPDGYDTYIEQGGTNVSGGQKQRLCIARALLKKPKILILDDSTSAVDTKTDALIREGFRSFIPETTKIIIAQRVASVEDADLILVMDNGRISAAGKHEELLTSCDIYREIYEQQTRGGNENE